MGLPGKAFYPLGPLMEVRGWELFVTESCYCGSDIKPLDTIVYGML